MKNTNPLLPPHSTRSSGVPLFFLFHGWFRWTIVLAVVALSSLSCVVGGDCKYDIDCLADQICDDGWCKVFGLDGGSRRKGCKLDTDCPSDQICHQQICQSTASLFEPKTQEPPPIRDRGPAEPLSQDSGGSPEVDREAPPPERPVAPLPRLSTVQHAQSSGAAMSSTAKVRHFVVVGQMTPLVPSATVMRSANYSLRPGVIAVTMW